MQQQQQQQQPQTQQQQQPQQQLQAQQQVQNNEGLSVLDRPTSKGTKTVALSCFSFLFGEIIKYNLQGSDNNEFQRKMLDFGFQIGYRFQELVAFREKKKEVAYTVTSILKEHINGKIWQSLFGKYLAEDVSHIMVDSEDKKKFQMFEREPICTRFVSIPNGAIRCAYFNAGIIKGVLAAADFPADVDVFHSDENWIVYIVQFTDEVLKRSDTSSTNS